MAHSLNPPLVAKRQGILKVLIIARISTEHQDVRSLDDQIAKAKEYVNQVYSDKVDWRVIQSRGSGEHLDRKELVDAEELIVSGELDLVISEDLARICRRKRAYDFCETCLDHQTRLIAINDRIDTAADGWEDAAFISTWHHERSNRDTAQRIRRSLRNRFSQGGVFQYVVYGYTKKPGGTTENDVSKDPSAEAIYDKWFRMLAEGASYSEVSDWLNEQGIATGPFSDSERWTCKMVARVTKNPILKGLRVRNKKMARRVNKTGRHVSVDAPPEERLERSCPHLAFIEPERYDRLMVTLQKRNACYTRKGVNGVDQRKGVSRKRTVWPGQHVRCGVCNRLFYWSGAGNHLSLRCSGNQAYQCWNGAEINAAKATKKMTEAIFDAIMNLQGFDEACLEKARQQWREQCGSRQEKRKELERRDREIEPQIANVTEAIAVNSLSSALAEKLRRLEHERDELKYELSELVKSIPEEPVLPTLEVVKERAAEVFTQFAADDPETGRLLQVLVPVLEVYPVQLCDGGDVVLRARMKLNLTALTSGRRHGAAPEVLYREITVDLFDPPQREKFRKEIVRLRASGMTEKDVAKQLDITITAAQRASKLQRLMDAQGLTDPYVRLLKPTTAGGLARHLHSRYRFEPLDEPTPES